MIRQAMTSDLENILSIYNDVILNTTAVYSYKEETMEQRQKWFEEKIQANLPVFVYELDNKVVGFASYGPFRAWPAYKYSIELSVHVSRDHRKKGIASALIKQLITDAKEKEYKTMIAGIDASNENSILLHQKFGFIHAGTIKNAGYKFGKWLDLAFYQLPLDGPKNPIEK